MKKILGFFVAVSLIISGILLFVPCVSAVGSGELVDPYQITNADELNETNDDLGACYILMNDIDLSGCEFWNGGEGFLPIGCLEDPFTGVFDGNGYTISNLFIDKLDVSGLFGYVETGFIFNLSLINIYVTGNNTVGGLVGNLVGGHVEQCCVSGNVTGNNTVGGLIGYNYVAGGGPFTILNCYSRVNVTGNNTVGGLIGYNENDNVTNCYSTGYVDGNTNVGGLVGNNTDGNIINCYWDNETSNQTTSDGGVGRTTLQMIYDYEGYDPSCTGLYENWSLVNYTGESEGVVWVHDDLFKNYGYPIFVWQYASDSVFPPFVLSDDTIFLFLFFVLLIFLIIGILLSKKNKKNVYVKFGRSRR